MAPPSASPSAQCPVCHAPVAPDAKFCAACGATLAPAPAGPVGPSAAPSGPAPAMGASGSPVDIRNRVDQDRGFLKRLQLLIPGFHGYRVNEDARQADSFLRLQVADKVKGALAQLGDIRTALVNAGAFQSLNDIAGVISDLQILEGTIRHAEQGYTGIAAPLRIGAGNLDRLYEYDYGFAAAADQLANAVGPIRTSILTGDNASARVAVDQLHGMVRQLQDTFRARVQVVEQIRVP
ncbi:MAG TPA: zinc ribbon domain-containing protein [Thermoplasmata archaeon]|nr:zinc ribbon domain-containing protein [Thermoplasmata archaeon]